MSFVITILETLPYVLITVLLLEIIVVMGLIIKREN